ncbi:MAG TPA: alpha/beta fold hydrolase [Phytomonospora sp.]
MIVLPGLGDGAFTWTGVLPPHAVVLDRLGHTGPFTIDGETDRIARAATRPPVLVAHSMAACYAEAYARRHPVTGLVLIDPSYEHEARTRAPRVPNWAAWLSRPALAWRLGPALWSALAVAQTRTAIPRHIRRRARQYYRDPRVVASAIAEYFAYDDVNAQLIALRARTDPPDVPVIVLAATPARVPVPDLAHVRLAARFPRADIRVLPGSGHLVHLDRPGAVRAAIAALEE